MNYINTLELQDKIQKYCSGGYFSLKPMFD